jgi:hypothetical protein
VVADPRRARRAAPGLARGVTTSHQRPTPPTSPTPDRGHAVRRPSRRHP